MCCIHQIKTTFTTASSLVSSQLSCILWLIWPAQNTEAFRNSYVNSHCQLGFNLAVIYHIQRAYCLASAPFGRIIPKYCLHLVLHVVFHHSVEWKYLCLFGAYVGVLATWSSVFSLFSSMDQYSSGFISRFMPYAAFNSNGESSPFPDLLFVSVTMHVEHQESGSLSCIVRKYACCNIKHFNLWTQIFFTSQPLAAICHYDP